MAVLAVTDDARFADDLRAAGCETIPDGVAGDLNESLRLAAAEARRRWPDAMPVAVCADLPALRSADLDAALASPVVGPARRSSPTTTASARRSTPRRTTPSSPRFGLGSRAGPPRTPVPARSTVTLPTLRRDVDDADALAAADALGLGAHTRLAMLA